MIFDTHAHYDDSAFDADRETVLDSLSDYMIINPGCNVQSSISAMNIAESHENVYFAAGLHPEDINEAQDDYLEHIIKMLNHPKCLAVGEIGLDYYWDSSNKETQKKIFSEQLKCAVDIDIPVIVHDREAHGDSLAAVKEYKGIKGVFHCFSGSREMAQELIKLGWYIGFDGPITYKNAKKTIEVLEMCPLDRILVETDSPYMSPVPKRGERNYSANLQYIIAKINDIKGITNAEEITCENAKRLFFK